ncbi:MAG: T9SS type A sorting domain-containing protein [Bacteroidetes bacterium]|nr:T9SS type A sorting domain-containing protein [Bacteroidota bacterium]
MIKSSVAGFLALALVVSGTLTAQIIERVPIFQPVSIKYAKATAAYQGRSVQWSVVCRTVDESTGASANVGDTVRATGDSVQLRLIKYDLKYTYYKVLAAVDAERDSVELQVFSKGSMQKYLFRIPIYASKPVPVHLYLPSTFSSASKLLLSMHGVDRNANSYGLAWTSYAAANNTIVLAPEFSADDWSGDAYSQGNVFTGGDGTGSLNVPERWTFTIVRDIQRTMARGFGLLDSTYTIWGHSAGGQFVHRMVLFISDSLRKTAIAANPGWYTAPDTATIFPWGVAHPFLWFTTQHLMEYTNQNLVIMRGTADTIRDSNLNTDSLSDLQGMNRFERAGFFYQKGASVNPSLRWQLRDVPDVGHEYQKMAVAAGQYLTSMTDVSDERDDIVPRECELLQNYPNPFNPITVVSYHIPVIGSQSSVVSVKVYDLLGREVAVLVDGVKPAGWHSVTWNAANVPSGVYLCRMAAGEQSSSIKMVLIK